MDEPDCLQILLLGPPEVRWRGSLLPIQRRIPRALLFYLASRGSMVGRQELLPLFWEEASDHDAQLRLRETLSRLRAALPDPEMILSDSDLVGLDYERMNVDLIEFQNLVRQAGNVAWKVPHRQPLPEHLLPLLQSAACLWRGTAFLAGADIPSSPSLDLWLSHTSQYLENQRTQVLERLAAHMEASANYELALHYTQLALAVNELDENLQLRVMQLLIRMGRRDQARGHYQWVRKITQDELGIEPGPALKKLYLQVHQDTHPIQPVGQQTWRIRPSLGSPFLGRETELAAVDLAYRLGGVILLLGEAGQGKSRLLQEFSLRLNMPNRLIISYCKPGEDTMPFQPVVDAGRIGLADFRDFSTSWASQFLPYLPELAELRPDLPLPAEEDLDKSKKMLFEATRQMGLKLSREMPLLGVLEDAQWADATTLDAIRYMAERPPFSTHDAALFLTARPEEHNPHLTALIEALQRSGHLTVISLKGLTEQDVSTLTAAVLSAPLPLEFSLAVHAFTGGNPFFILESLRSWSRQPLSTERLSLSANEAIRELVRDRLEKLAPEVYEALEVAAVIGIEFEPSLLGNVLQIDPQNLADCLDALRTDGLIQMLDAQGREKQFAFVHGCVRQILLNEINPIRLNSLHMRIAQVMESTLDPQRADILAHHWELTGDWRKAFLCWAQFAEYSITIHDKPRAYQACIRAERLVLQYGHYVSDDEILTIYQLWGESAYEQNDVAAMQRLYQTLMDLGHKRHSSPILGAALIGLSDVCMVNNQFDQGLAFASQAVAHLTQSDHPALLARAMNARGVFLYMRSRIDEALNTLEDVLKLSAGLNDPALYHPLANTNYQLGFLNAIMGWPAAASQYASRALALSCETKYTHAQVTAHNTLAFALLSQGSFLMARNEAELGIQLAQQIQAYRMLGYLHLVLGMAELALGNLREAIKQADQGLAIGKKYNYPEMLTIGHRLHGDVFAALGLSNQAFNDYQKGLEISREGFWGLDISFRLGYTLALMGQVENGLMHNTQVVAVAQQMNLHLIAVVAQISQAGLLAQTGSWERAENLARQMVSETQKRSMLNWELAAKTVLASTEVQKGDISVACALYEEIIQQSARLPYPWVELRASGNLASLTKSNFSPLQRKRMHTLLDQMAAHLPGPEDDPDYESVILAFERYRQGLLLQAAPSGC